MNFELQSTFNSERVSLKSQVVVWIGLGLLSNLLFFKQNIGLNLFIGGLTLLLFWRIQGVSKANNLVFALAVFLACSALYNGTGLTLILFAIALLAIIGHKSASAKLHLVAWFCGFMAWIEAPFKRPIALLQAFVGKKMMAKKQLRLAILPIIITCLFSLFYVNGNYFLNEWLIELSSFFNNAFIWFEQMLGWQRFWFLLLMMFITVGLILPFHQKYAKNLEDSLATHIKRQVGKPTIFGDLITTLGIVPKLKMTALKYEAKLSLLVLVSLNMLLVISNVSDLMSLLNPNTFNPQLLYKHVHEGTLALSISLIFSTGLIMYVFRGNLNFLKNKSTLLVASKIWIVQNALLIALIAIRNWQYVEHYGLTYKRLGVFYFLLLMFVGLIFIWYKLTNQHSTFSVLKNSLYAIFISLSILSPFNWAGLIASYNLEGVQTSAADIKYLMDLPSGAIPSLIKYEPAYGHLGIETRSGIYSYSELLEIKTSNFMNQEENTIWASWDLQSHQISQAIKNSTTHLINH